MPPLQGSEGTAASLVTVGPSLVTPPSLAEPPVPLLPPVPELPPDPAVVDAVVVVAVDEPAEPELVIDVVALVEVVELPVLDPPSSAVSVVLIVQAPPETIKKAKQLFERSDGMIELRSGKGLGTQVYGGSDREPTEIFSQAKEKAGRGRLDPVGATFLGRAARACDHGAEGMRSVAHAPIAWVVLFGIGCGATTSGARDQRASTDLPRETTSSLCPEEMVLVPDRFCIDRFEASMLDEPSGRPFSPFYPPDLDELHKAVNGQPWGLAALGKEQLRPAVPLLPEWELSPGAHVRAVSRKGVVPQAYLSQKTARAACSAAGKRLCTLSEWKVACRGEHDTRFPYGATYQNAACNVRGHHHAAAILWGDASRGHWDPRLNQVEVDGVALVKLTGDTSTCRSAWGDDGIYDMVGNLDEWVDDPSTKGTFVGGFYARDTTRGCDAKISEHPAVFFDFSTGARCCADLRR